MKSLELILEENINEKNGERRRKFLRGIGNRLKNAGRSLSSFAKDVVTEPHVGR